MLRTRIMLRLHPSSHLAKLSVILVCAALLFHILAISSSNWCQFEKDGRLYNLGLWSGCILDKTGTKTCPESLPGSVLPYQFWHRPTAIVMMTSLFAIFGAMLLILEYTFLEACVRHRTKLAECTAMLLLIEGSVTTMGIVIFGTEVLKIPADDGPHLGWSFAMAILSLMFSVCTGLCIALDRWRYLNKFNMDESGT